MKRTLCALFLLALSLTCMPASAELQEPEADSETDIQMLHVGQTRLWKPFSQYAGLYVTYKSNNPKVLSVSPEGLLTALSEGEAMVTATTEKTKKYKATVCESPLIYVLSSADGLYVNEVDSHFYYQGKKYASGKLPTDVERKLCETQEDLKVFLRDYLYPYQEKISDKTEAALTAIINYGANYFKKHFKFADVGGLAEDAKEDWMRLLVTKRGVCVPCSSLFCYLMYLSGLPSMIVETPKVEERAHDWNLIEHGGYYYNLENHALLHYQYDRYVMPPFSKATAGYFPGNIYGVWFMHYPVSGGAFGPDKKVADMERDLSEACPIIMCEKKSNGEYRIYFETIRKSKLPTWEDGTPVILEEIIYRSMETGDGADAQFNETANPLFIKADHMLWREIVGMFDALILPGDLKSVEASAFRVVAAQYAVFPEGITSIAQDILKDSKVKTIFGKSEVVKKYVEKAGLKYVEG